MSRLIPHVTKLLLLSLLVIAAGCSEQKEQMGDQDQAAGAEAARIQELQDLLAQTERDLAAAHDQALGLRTENDRLKEQLARSSVSPASGWSAIPGGAMTAIEGTILFDSGKAVLKPAAKEVLGGVARVINEKFAGYEIYIFGHTDNEPISVSGWTDNYELSCQRALAVLRHLRDEGVAQHICPGGWGEDRPVADNATTESRQANRRVEIFAMAPQETMTGSARATLP